eukprot:788315-Prorocentrum_minimum.AAC.1
MGTPMLQDPDASRRANSQFWITTRNSIDFRIHRIPIDFRIHDQMFRLRFPLPEQIRPYCVLPVLDSGITRSHPGRLVPRPITRVQVLSRNRTFSLVNCEQSGQPFVLYGIPP